MSIRPREEAPESVNREQDDEPQAQDVAEDALHPGEGLGDSRHGPGDRTQIMPDDTPDLVDKMNEMVRSGRIDNDAYAGEPMHDDEEDILGDTDSEDDPLDTLLSEGEDDPLGSVASEWGLEDADEDEEPEDELLDDDDLEG
jgi:hypothetical protein